MVYLENSVEVIVAIYAILKAGAVFVVVNPTTKAEKLRYILNDCRATGLITDAVRLQAIREYWSEIPHLQSVWVAGRFMLSGGDSKVIVPLDSVLIDASLPDHKPPKRCIDIDLAGTPFTNTLPIRRLNLTRRSGTAKLRMLYVPFDSFEPTVDGQHYTCLEDGRLYRYQAEDGSFTADLPVDEDGLVLDYPTLFRRLSPETI